MLTTPSPETIAAMLAEAGLSTEFQRSSLPGGANNRVYRLDCGDAAVLLKVYFHHPDDPRDRLGTEYAFSRFAWDRGLRCLPRPLTCDRDASAALYEFVEGRPLVADELASPEVDQAIEFYRELNRYKSHPAAKELPCGSEACFTFMEHLARVERRLARLEKLDDSTPLGQDAVRFVREELAPGWDQVRHHLITQAAVGSLSLVAPIPSEDECLSPSDFGFHNAIRQADGRLRFIDFEYAGWDDPGKTVCDFLCQPAVPVPAGCAERFAEAVVAELSDPAMHLRRIALMRPVYRVKWCCIMLNEFLPVSDERRAFARQGQDQDDRKRTQLDKARNALRLIRV
jgi:hypothetical protein